MKALHQIIDYLRDYGQLTPEQLDAFVKRGIYPAHRLGADASEVIAEAVGAAVIEPDDEFGGEHTAAAGRAAGRAGRGGAGRVQSLKEKVLAQRLAELGDGWRPRLAGLTRLAQRLRSCTAWQDAAIVIRNADADDLIAAVAIELDADASGLADLWSAADLDDYHAVLRSEDRIGNVVNAYKAMLRCNSHHNLGQYGWLLRSEAIAAVFNLKLAQNRLLRAWGEVFHARPELTAASLRRVDHAAYWSFVLLYSARRPAGSRDERPPPRQPPEARAWPRFWARAVAMDPAAATTYLVDREETLYDRPLMLVNLIASALQGYPLEDRLLLQRFYHHNQSPPQIATWAKRPEADVHTALNRFRRDLNTRLGRHPRLLLFLRSELARGWQGFLGDLLRQLWSRDNAELAEDDLTLERRTQLVELIDVHFGAAYDLLCPRNWD